MKYLKVSEDVGECESFSVISIDSDNKYYLQPYVNNCAYKILSKLMIDRLCDNLFEADEN